MLLPLTLQADRLPIPVTTKVRPGVSDVRYAAQTFRFTTPVALVVRFEPVTTTTIKMTVRAYSQSSSGSQAPLGTNLNIHWQDWGTDVYSGPPPYESAWEGLLNTESGFTEK
jgi:hypothetical protein